MFARFELKLGNSYVFTEQFSIDESWDMQMVREAMEGFLEKKIQFVLVTDNEGWRFTENMLRKDLDELRTRYDELEEEYKRLGNEKCDLQDQLDELKLGSTEERWVKAAEFMAARVVRWNNAGLEAVGRKDDFIENIKKVRELTKCGLKEAKDFVESWKFYGGQRVSATALPSLGDILKEEMARE